MKNILAVALILATAVATLSFWGMMHARQAGSSSSQIFIHGTPVCITQQEGNIVAMVGECGLLPRGPGSEDGGVEKGPSPFGDPDAGLPPGHPPVGPEGSPFGGDVRRVPI